MKIRSGRYKRHRQLVGAPQQNGQHVVLAEEAGLRSAWGRRRIIDTEEPEPQLGSTFYTDLDTGYATFDADKDRYTATERVFNDGGADLDFRIEGDGDVDLVSVDASVDMVGIGVPFGSIAEKLHVDGNIRAEQALKFRNGTGFDFVLTGVPSATRTATFQDASGTVAYVDDIPTTEEMQDLVAAMILNGTGISFVYDDGAGTITPTVTLAPFNTGNLAEGANLYFTDERVDDRVSVLIVNGTGISWAYNDGAGTFTPTVTLAPFNTGNLAEGANLYFTNERVDDRVAVLIVNGTGISWVYDDGAGTFTPTVTLAPFTTANLTEGANLYFTDERVDDRVAALVQNGTGITWAYNDGAGTFTPTVSLAAFSTTNLAEGANLYFTDERAQDAVGTIFVDSATIDFTYTDATPEITAIVINDSITNTKLSNMAAWTVKIRNNGATGDPSDADAAAITTEGSPAAGDFMWLWTDAGGGVFEIKKVNWSSLPGGGGGISIVKEDNINAVTGAVALDFNGDDFNITDEGGGEALIEINRNVADGIAGLDADAKVPTAQLPDTLDTHAWSTPAALTVDTDDYNFDHGTTGDKFKSAQRISASGGTWAIRGIEARTGGWIYILRNVGLLVMRIEDEAVSSSAANRIKLNVSSTILILEPGQCIRMIYDDTDQRWICFPMVYNNADVHSMLDGLTHSDTANSGCTRGDIIVGNASNLWDDLAIGAAGFVVGGDATDVSWVRNYGTTVYEPTCADVAINSVTDITVATRDVVGAAAGDVFVIEADFIILNNSGAARVYNITIDFDNAGDVEWVTGSLAASSTLMHPFMLVSKCNIRSTSLVYMVGRADAGPIAGIVSGGDPTMAATGFSSAGWFTSGSNLTGTLTCNLKIRSANATATQTCRLVNFEVRRITPGNPFGS